MVKYNVIWTRTADLQLVGVLEYWLKRNKSNAYSKKLIKLVSRTTKRIAARPLSYKSTDFENTRVASMGNYSIFYKIESENIIITSFWDNRQNPGMLLKILKDKK